MGYHTISQQMSDTIKHITYNIAHAQCMQNSPTAAALWTSFLLNHAPQQPRADYKI